MVLTVPQAGTGEGARSARVRVEAPQTGTAVAGFGQAVKGFAERIETDRLRSQSTRARIDMQADMNNLRLEMEQIGDPDEIDTQMPMRLRELRQKYVDNAPHAKLQEDLGFAFDELANRQSFAVGAQSIELRQSRARAELNQFGDVVLQGAHGQDPGVRAAMIGQYADAVADAVDAGHLTPEQGEAKLSGLLQDADDTAALRLLEDDPAGLLAALEGDEFSILDPNRKEVLRSRARSALASSQAAEAKKADLAAKEATRVMGQRLSDATSVLLKGRQSTDAIDLLMDPAAKEHPDFPEFEAALTLLDAAPGFAALPPAEQKEVLAREEAKKITKPHEAREVEAYRTIAAQSEKAWADDAIGTAAEVLTAGFNDNYMPPELDLSDENLGSEDFVNQLAARRHYGMALVDEGYVDASRPQFFSAEERSQIASLIGPDQDIGTRMKLAVAIRQGLGPQAVAGFRELGDDQVFGHMGGLLASGGHVDVVHDTFLGQQALAEGTVTLPADKLRNGVLQNVLGDYGAGRSINFIKSAADARFAFLSQGSDPDDAAEIYTTAVQDVLGAGLDSRQRKTGGMQVVNGEPTLMPIGVSGEAVDAALDAAIAQHDYGDVSHRLYNDPERVAEWWSAMSAIPGEKPYVNGEVLDDTYASTITLRAAGGDTYDVLISIKGHKFPVKNASGEKWTISLNSLLREYGE